MIPLLLGAAVLVLLLAAMRAFANASVASVKALVAWVAALGGLTLALLLLLTGRGPIALAALSLLGPLLVEQWRQRFPPGAFSRDGFSRGQSAGERTAPPPGGKMTREEAYQVLGLRPGAGSAEIRAAWVRLMRAAHPDNGGSDWLAARVNMARDVLLGRDGRRR